MGEGERAARAGVAEGTLAEHRREHARRHEPHAERAGEDEHLVRLAGRCERRPGPSDRVRVEQAHAIDVTDGGGVDAGEGPRVGDAVGGWDLGGIVNARTGLPLDIRITRPDIVYRDTRNGTIVNAPVLVGTAVVTEPTSPAFSVTDTPSS